MTLRNNLLKLMLVAYFLSACQGSLPTPKTRDTDQPTQQQATLVSGSIPTDMPTVLPQSTLEAMATPYPTYTGVATGAATPTSTVTCPRTVLFYGDSRMGGFGVSFVNDIGKLIEPCYKLVLTDYWGRTAEWGWENFQQKVLDKNPDDVVLWWGGNDFGGCQQTTNFDTNLPDMAKFNAALNSYISALRNQIDTLVDLGKGVYVLNEPRIQGGFLPWAVVDNNGNVTYDHNHLCKYDWVSDAMAQAQRQLVADENAQGHKVVLLDIWQLYMDNSGVDGMYSPTDVVHTGEVGREKIAELFMQLYKP